MTAQASELEIMDEDRLVEEVLDKFVNCHEQTYEEFLSTFTHLSKEDNGTNRRAFGTDYSENIFTSVKPICENEPKDQNLRKRDIFLCTSLQWSEEEQIVIDEGQKVGSFFQGDLNRAGKVKVDNFLDVEDLDLDEQIKPQMNEGWLLLPGEVEQQVSARVPSYVPSVAQPVTPGVKPRHAANGAGKQMDKYTVPVKEHDHPFLENMSCKDLPKGSLWPEMILGDEVQPFSLDEEFDYDTVLLTPKFTPAETDAIKELSKQKRKNTDAGVEEPCD